MISAYLFLGMALGSIMVILGLRVTELHAEKKKANTPEPRPSDFMNMVEDLMGKPGWTLENRSASHPVGVIVEFDSTGNINYLTLTVRDTPERFSVVGDQRARLTELAEAGGYRPLSVKQQRELALSKAIINHFEGETK